MKPAKKNTIEAKIAKLLQQGKPYSFICSSLQTSSKRVSRVSMILKSTSQIPNPLKMGRPMKVTQDIANFVYQRTIEEPRLSNLNLSNQITGNFDISICKSLISKTRKTLGFVYTHPRKRQALTQSQIERRIKFCEEQLMNAEKWKFNVIITDESRFGIYPDNSMLWLQRGVYNENTFESTEKFSKTLMVWAGIGYNYKSELIFVESTLGSAQYIKMLIENKVIEDIKNKISDREVFFQQDGAPAHNSKNTKEYLRSKISLVEDWPPNSPDLSVIENLWAILKKKVMRRNPTNLVELKEVLIAEWKQLDQNMINNLIMETPERFRLCLREKGKSISRILHRIKEYNNENVPTLEELNSIGAISPKGINEFLIGNTIIIAGIILEVKEFTLAPEYFISKMIDHPLHVNQEFPMKVALILKRNLKESVICGNYHCVSGRYISEEEFAKSVNINWKSSSPISEYLIVVDGVD